MNNDRFRMGLFVFIAALTFLLALDLLVLDAVVLPILRKLLDAACIGDKLPFVNQVFHTVVPNAARICASDYQDKLTYAYKALTVPLLSLAVGAAVLTWQVYKHRTVKESIRLTPRRLSLAILWILATVMLVYIQLGSYVRFVGDDYCMAAEVFDRGVIGATIFWYKSLISRFSTNLLLSIEGVLGPPFVPFYPAFFLFALIATTTYAVYQVTFAQTRRARLILSLLLSSAVIFATLQASIDLPQSLYWASSRANMLPPLVLLAFCVGLLLRGITQGRPARFGWKWLILAGFLALVAGGFVEAFTAFQVGFWGLVLLITFQVRIHNNPRDVQGMAVAFLIGSLAALALHLAAPGFEGRLEGDYSSTQHSILSTIPIALTTTLNWLKWVFLSMPRSLSLLALSLLSLLASVRFFEDRLRSIEPLQLGRRTLVLLPPAAFVLLYACFVPAAYATGGPPPGRHLIVPAYILSIAVALAGILIGQVIAFSEPINRRKIFDTLGLVTLALLLITSLQAIRGQLRLLRGFARYQEAWDANEVVIQAAIDSGDDHVTITALPGPWWNVTNRDIGPDPDHWINQCASRYYGIEVTAIELTTE